ncbi:MAG: polyphosphate kinase 2 family protein [Tissierellia bacterium]|nr:polyphosphate kinase 2 family protein [Tissierellia bacterium]
MDTKDYLVKGKIKLKDYDTSYNGRLEKDEVKNELMPKNLELMAEFQEKLYADGREGVLIVIQATDTAGKDGVITNVMEAFNPQGVKIASFKSPNKTELKHDYLWRIVRNLPERGTIGIFNRSHYEDVLAPRVLNLMETYNVPDYMKEKDFYKKRFRQINDFERYLSENGFRIVKFFLHLSKDKQKENLLERIEMPSKNWKFETADMENRKHWDDYEEAYEDMLNNTSTDYAPWYVIPSDRKWFQRYVISEIMVELLKDMDPKFPVLNEQERLELQKWRGVLLGE